MYRFKLAKDKTSFDFMRVHKLAFAASFTMMALSIVLLFTKGLNFGIDFTGGLMMEVKTPAAVQIESIRESLESLSAGTPTIQEFGENEVMIKIPGKEADMETQKALYAEVQRILGAEVEFRRVEYVGPQVGHELIIAGVKAFVYSMIGIMLYIWFRFEWQFGVTGVFALAHDVCATLLFFILTGIEFDLSTVAAVLLVAGYSINDTVVVFDRIREMMRKYRKMPLAELFNLAINQTLSRTLMTGFTTLLALAAIWLFGSEVIRGFTLALIIGIIVGVYSSVFIASAQLLYLNLRRDPVLATVEDGEPVRGAS
jgi:preprotein translocase subunit SecF